jgi:hypothetical protein
MTKFRNMRTPFWNVVDGVTMIATGLAKVLSVGLYDPEWHFNFGAWRLLRMFDKIEE